jgi:hypothetical protein
MPSRTRLEARTDQELAEARELRAGLAAMRGDGDYLLGLGDDLAGLLREQFPAAPALGRITLAVAGSITAMRESWKAKGFPLTEREVGAAVRLAAERLEREAGRG